MWEYIIGALLLIWAWNQFLRKSQKYKSFAGQIVLITGAGSGIGRLMAIEFAKMKCKLVLLDLNEKGLDEVSQFITNIGESAPHNFKCDVSNKEDVKRVADDIKKNIGKVDVLVNNAGIVAGGRSWELKEEQVEKVFKVNTLGVIWMMKQFLPAMIEENRGHLITIASSASFLSIPGLADYCASKAAAYSYHEGVRMELKKWKKLGVKTTVVCPYYINTGMFDGVKNTNPFLSILDPNYVVSRIMEAARMDQEELIIPEFMVKQTFIARYLLPSQIRDVVSGWMGLDRTMDDFHGKRRI